MLATDVNNQEFSGAIANPDDLLHVEFYWCEPIDKWASDEKGREIKGPRQPFVRIMKPGDQTSIIETRVREDHKARWPKKWLYWQMKEGLISGGENIPGWKVEEWPEVIGNDSLLNELKYLRFYTVEQIAGASDSQVQGMGMIGPSLREKAKRALSERMNAGTTEALKERDQKIADLQIQMQELLKLVKPQVDIPPTESAVAMPVVEEDIRVRYENKFGKKPHHRMKEETIRKALE